MSFNEYKDGNVEGINVNVTDSDTPANKAKVSSRGEVSSENLIDDVASPIHTSVGTSAVRIDDPTLTNRKKVDIQANKNVFIGFSNTITTSAGYYLALKKGQIVSLEIGPSIQLWAIANSTGTTGDVVLTQGRR